TNHWAPSGPATISLALLPGVGSGNSVIAPAVVIRPILLLKSVNHNAPSHPAVMAKGWPGLLTVNSVMSPEVVMRPIWLAVYSVNHSAPSGPAMIFEGRLIGVRRGYSSRTPALLIRPILLPEYSANHIAPSGPGVTP